MSCPLCNMRLIITLGLWPLSLVIKPDMLIHNYISSTLYVGMVPKNNGCPYISIASDELKSLLIS